MPQPHVLVLRAPGTNCDLETAHAFEKAGGRPQRMHIRQLLENPRATADFQILCLPGGFSYGDDLAAGRILGSQIRHHLADALAEFKAQRKLILGICNGFQVLVKAGILLEDDPHRPTATLTNNDSGKFEDRWVHLQVASPRSVFFRGIDSLYLPVAHAEGKFVPRDPETLKRLEDQGQVVLRYSRADGEANGGVAYPDNPNGSVAHIAGICDSSGLVCGLMPHPERYVDPTQHPHWTRLGDKLPEEGMGLQVFRNAVEYFR